MEKGTLSIQEEESVFEVNAGESLLLWPFRRHVGMRDFPADLRFYWLHFELQDNVSASEWVKHLSLPQHSKSNDPQYIISLFRQFLNEQERLQRSPALEIILLLILQQIASSALPESDRESSGVALAYKAQHLIHTQFHLPLSTSSLARELNCNADYLGRIYRSAFHLTVTEAIHRQRIRAAEKMLVNESLSLKEVAERCGFNDVGYFRQIFRKHTSITPVAWKRRYCKEHINSD
ncbi:AraC family transcriptional regulator [Mixta theicola]|nr:AraC family transcriptional regulator [Mixta theicola]